VTATAKKLYGGTLSTSAGTVLYTAPSSTTTVITSLTICNKTATAATITMAIDGVTLFAAATVNGNETWLIGPSDLRQAMATTTTITGSAGTSATIDVRISGAEIT
jgi:hypothetical protein